MPLTKFYFFRRIAFSMTALLVCLTACPALAQTTNTWTGTTSTDWNTAANWNPTRVPLATDDVVIAPGSPNQPILNTTAVANSVEVQGGASLSITSAGSLTINGSKNVYEVGTTAFVNSGTVTSGGQLVIGNTAAVGNYGLLNQATFSNQPGGRIQIDNSTTYGLYNRSGSFTNSATVTIGANAAVGSYGLVNFATFTNQGSGQVAIDRSTTAGLGNLGSFTNSAGLTIGAVAGVGTYGLYNNAPFTNQGSGQVAIDRSTNTGLFNTGGSFTNSAGITIGAVAGVGSFGIYNQATFTNQGSGQVAIDRSTTAGLGNVGSFTNSAGITIGAVAGVGATGIANRAPFMNQGCGALLNIVADAVITNTNTFSNTGTIIENASGNSSISSNAGLVQNRNDGTFTIGTNTGVLTTSAGLLWTGCTSTDWNTATNWSQLRVPLATDNVVIVAGPANQPVLGAGTAAVANSVEVQSGASLSIVTGASLTLNGSKNFILPDIGSFTSAFIVQGSVTNSGQVVIGNASAASVGVYGLVNTGTFANQGGGQIAIDRSTTVGLYNLAGSFTNSAGITIGAVAGVGQIGIYNNATFTNQGNGQIAIDRSTAYGSLNYAGSFTNSAGITIGAVAGVGQIGIYTIALFTNQGSGQIAIDRSTIYGLANAGSFINSAGITIGAVAGVGQYGLANGGTFANQSGGQIAIDRSTSAGLLNVIGSNFTNSAVITIGAVAGVGPTGIQNGAPFMNQGCGALLNIVADAVITNTSSFSNTGTIIENASGNSSISSNAGLVQNRNGGTFTIGTNTGVLTTSAGLLWTGCTSTDWNTATNWSQARVPLATDDVVIVAGPANQPVIGSGTAAVANSVEVQSGASLSIVNGASLTLNGSKSFTGPTLGTVSGAFIVQGSVRNSGQVVIGNASAASVGQYGLVNTGTFANQGGGQIAIDRSTTLGLYNAAGSFTNSAGITIGAVAGVGSYGIYNQATFTNQGSGQIALDRSILNGLANVAGSFTNSAGITIGAVAGGGQFGIYNNAPFMNQGSGQIAIDRSTDYGLANDGGGSFTNSAGITIGGVALGKYGLGNAGTFANQSGGQLAIDRSTIAGLYNYPASSFTNSAGITIGAVAGVGPTGIQNDASFANQGCGAVINIVADAVITNTSSFSNTGTIIENASGNSSISSNAGLVQNHNGGTFTITTNTGVLADPLTGCSITPINPALQLGTGNPFSVGTTWYGDAARTTPLGTYSPNTLTLPNAYTGKLYFTLTDAPNSCTLAGAVSVTVNASPTVSIMPSPSLNVVQGSSTQLTASGGDTYRWSTTQTINPISVGVAGPYSVTGTTTAGCSNTATVTLIDAGAALGGSLVANPVSIFAGSSLTLTASVGGGKAPYTYSFSGPGTIIPSGNTAIVTGLPVGLHTFSVLVGDGGSQSTMLTVTVTVTGLPTNILTVLASASPATLQSGGTTTLTASAAGGIAPYSYSFSGPGTISKTGNTATVSALPVGVHSFTVLVVDSDPNLNQKASRVVSVTVSEVPVGPSPLVLTATASPTTILTSGSTTLLASASGGTPGYTYSFSGPGTISQTGNTATVSGLPVGVQSFIVSVRDAASPSQQLSQVVSVTVSAVPVGPSPLVLTATASPSTILASGSTTLLASASGGTPGSPGGYTYTFSGPGTISQTGNTATVSGLPVGVQSFTVSVQDAASPSQQLSQVVSVTVNPVPVTPPSGVFSATVVSYNCVTGELVLGSVGGNGSAVTYAIPGVTNFTPANTFVLNEGLRRDATTITVSVQQGGVAGVSFVFNLRAFCQGGSQPTPPTPPTPPVTGGALSATVVSYNCATGDLVLGSVGGTGGVVEYAIPGVTNYTPTASQNLGSGIRRDASSVTINVRQGGVAGTPFVFNFRSFCQGQASARLAVTSEPVSDLTVTVLGNPARGQSVVEISGAAGQALSLRLVDLSGRLVEMRQIPVAAEVERQVFDLSRLPAVLLLQVQAAKQTKTVRIVQE